MPVRSMSSNGPIGKPAVAHRLVDRRSTVAAPLSRIRSASIVNGRLTRLTMKPGRSAQRTGVLPQVVMIATARGHDRGVGERRRDDLDEGHERRGVEEVEADDPLRAGSSASAIAATESALVLVARIDVGVGHRVERPEDRPLQREVLERRTR